jgi:hypothetical protein
VKSREIRTRNWSDDGADRKVRPCSSCNVQRENDTLRERAVGWKACAERNQWQASHWRMWQAAVSPGQNLQHALYRAMDESGLLLGLIFAIGGFALYGLASCAVVVMAALQEAAK